MPGDELAGLRKDEIGLEFMRMPSVEVRERHTCFRVPYTGKRLRDGVSGFVMPHREVVYFNSKNANEDSENLPVGHVQDQVCVHARTLLVKRREMKSGRVSDRLHTSLPMVGWRNRLLLVGRGIGVI